MFEFATNAWNKTSDAFGSATGALSETMDDATFSAKSKIKGVTSELTREKDKVANTSPFKTDFALGDTSSYFKPTTEFGGSSFSDNFAQDSAPTDAGAVSPHSKANLDLMEDGGKYQATTEFGGKTDKEKGVDWDAFARMLQTIKPQDEFKISGGGGRVGGGFQFNRKPYENQLLTREYESLYNQPLYNKLV